MLHWLLASWGQVWPNLIASAMAGSAVFTWHHHQIKITVTNAVQDAAAAAAKSTPTNQ